MALLLQGRGYSLRRGAHFRDGCTSTCSKQGGTDTSAEPIYSPPRACPAGAGGPGLRLPKTVDRARRNLKPTTRPISHCARSRPNPFLDACHAIALQPNLQRSATRWLVGRLSALASRATPPRLALTPRTRRMQRCGRPSRRRLRVRRRPACSA